VYDPSALKYRTASQKPQRTAMTGFLPEAGELEHDRVQHRCPAAACMQRQSARVENRLERMQSREWLFRRSEL
jgi:hypothetical protein